MGLLRELGTIVASEALYGASTILKRLGDRVSGTVTLDPPRLGEDIADALATGDLLTPEARELLADPWRFGDLQPALKERLPHADEQARLASGIVSRHIDLMKEEP